MTQRSFDRASFNAQTNDLKVMTTIDECQKLLACPKVSKAQEPNNRGTCWLARLIYVVDADTIVVARYVDDKLQREKIRITDIDAGEVKHLSGDRKVTPYEQALGAVTKNYILNSLSSDHFQIDITDKYKDMAQKKVFDVKPIIVKVNCPMTDSKGKVIDLDRYGRNLAAVTVIQIGEKSINWDIGQDLLEKQLVDNYEGEKKARSFMKSTNFLNSQNNTFGVEIIAKLNKLFAQLSVDERV